jgi:hypothetical protein
LHLPYLYRLFNGEPELFLSNFTGPWVGERSLYLFFRPLTEVSLMVDYFFNHEKAFGYHLSNLIWHTINAFLLFLFSKALLEKLTIGEERDRLFMAACAAALFAVFPTQSEAIAWILARADLVSTFYLLLSLYFFVAKHDKTILSLAAFLACLLSKETAISLPLIIFALSITLSQAQTAKQRIVQASKETAPYLVVFAFYLAWRYLAIGKLIGGYVGSIGERLYENFFARWVSSGSLWQLLHPFNQAIFAENHVLRLILRLLYALAGVLVIIGTTIDQKLPSKQKPIYFALVFLLATMLPNFQVWGLSSSMSGSRIAYLPSVGLALLIVFSVYLLSPKLLPLKSGPPLKTTSQLALVALMLTFACITNGNNVAWLNSAKMIRELKSSVESEVARLADGQKLVVFNLPSRIDGAFTFTTRSMLTGLFTPGLFTPRLFTADSLAEISDRVVPLDYHPNWSIFVNRHDFASVIKQPQLYKLAVYDAALGKLVLTDLSQANEQATLSTLSAYPSLPALSLTLGQGPKSSSYYLKPEGSVKSINPLAVDFLEVVVKVTKKYPHKFPRPDDKASLFIIWNNRPADQEDQTEPHWMAVPADGQEHKILIELAPQKRWLLSKNVDMIRLDVATEDYDWQISKPKLLDANAVTPFLATANTDDNYALAPLSADRKTKNEKSQPYQRAITFDYDASKLRGHAVVVEVSKPYASFEHYDNLMRERNLNKRALLRAKLNDLKGSFIIETKADSKHDQAVYQVHVAALDEAGQVVGTFSDSVTIRSALPSAITVLPAETKALPKDIK